MSGPLALLFYTVVGKRWRRWCSVRTFFDAWRSSWGLATCQTNLSSTLTFLTFMYNYSIPYRVYQSILCITLNSVFTPSITTDSNNYWNLTILFAFFCIKVWTFIMTSHNLLLFSLDTFCFFWYNFNSAF